MLSPADRKDAIRKYKERKPRLGAFAVRCIATGRVWAGSSRNLDATKNRFWFGLRLGGHANKSLQEEWNRHGESAFEYEVLEVLDDDLVPLGISDLLKEKRLYWINRLDALPVE